MGKHKIVYPVCCAMDVHRDFLIACIHGITENQSIRFSTYAGRLRELRDWLAKNDSKDVRIVRLPAAFVCRSQPSQNGLFH